MSGYCPCKCPTCFEVAIADDVTEGAFCNSCADAGCDGESDDCIAQTIAELEVFAQSLDWTESR